MEQYLNPHIPEEIVRHEILSRFDPLSLLKYCEASKDSKKYCNDPSFMKTYNENISHDDYQVLVLDEAYKGNSDNFFTLVTKAEFFDQIIDKRTLRRSHLYFIELNDKKSIQKIEDINIELKNGLKTVHGLVNGAEYHINEIKSSIIDIKSPDPYINADMAITLLIKSIENVPIELNEDGYIGSFFSQKSCILETFEGV